MQKKISLGTYLAHAGVCSRRKADALVRRGLVQLNGMVVKEPGVEVKKDDTVSYQGRVVQAERKVYVLLNKPLDCLSAAEDEDMGRSTVVDLVKDACPQRLYPVGRLDYRTTGLIVLTNDGDVAQRLSHPRYEVPKIYKATLNANFKQSDITRVKRGVVLEDGPVIVDDIYHDPHSKDKKQVIVVIHSGKNRIIRRLFQHVGYRTLALDRINYAGLTKKGLKVGHWRFLTNQEVIELKRQSKAH